MDDYTFQQELEALAGNAYNPDLDHDTVEPMSTTISRWQTLFGLTQDEAVERIQIHRNNLIRPRISDAHWESIEAEKSAMGYDREAYEYELELQKRKAALPNLLPASNDSTVTYLVELTGPLDSPEKVQQAAGMASPPQIVAGQSVEDKRAVWLCYIDGAAKTSLLRWAAEEGKGFEPTVLVNPKSLR
jgi:hypothetical protein